MLQSVKLAIALRQSCIDEPYSLPRFGRDLIAGITVGIIAIPLAMALAIASGVPPQHGLYTAIIAGIVIAVLPAMIERLRYTLNRAPEA